MRYLIFFLAINLQLFANQSSDFHEKRIALLIKSDFRGEISFAYRIKAACKNLRWEATIIDIEKTKKLKNHNYDFVINLVPGSYKFPKCKNYLAIFHPLHHYFQSDGLLKKIYADYDGYLLTFSPTANDKNFQNQRLPYIRWFPTSQTQEYREIEPKNLFHLCCTWGNRFKEKKFQKILQILDKQHYTCFYGSHIFQLLYPQSYKSSIPYDSTSLHEIIAKTGISLIFHSDEHNFHRIPSGRIFEAAAASAVIISDENAFIKEHFGNSVLYVNTNTSADAIYEQVENHMNWIQANKPMALEMAKKAHKIYKEHFLLENQLIRLSNFHHSLQKKTLTKFIWKMYEPFSTFLKKIKTVFSKNSTSAKSFRVHSSPITVLSNIDSHYSLINSVDFHPQKNFFCVTYTHNNKVFFYEIDEYNEPRFVQSLCNPQARLSEPQHAVFSPDGKRVVIANWTNQTLNVYQQKENGLFYEKPVSVIFPPDHLRNCKPHGISFSPCGNYLAIAYGASSDYDKGIALFRSKKNKFQCIHLLKTLPGTPKGITFSPDGTSLIVTFAEEDCIGVFEVDQQSIHSTLKQIIRGEKTCISRPEDVKISPDARFCAVSNSDKNTVTFYPFDRFTNTISQSTPFYMLENPEAQLLFPHGIAFSPDGRYLIVTQFGQVYADQKGDIVMNPELKSSEAKICLYQLE